MGPVTNLKLSIQVFFCIYYLTAGVDTYIILPSAWYYIRSLGFSKRFYGAVIAAHPLGYILFSLIVGKVSDKTRAVKLVFLACTIVKVTSNFVYAIPVSGYFPLIGCFFSGAANSASGAMYGEIVRYTMSENRSKIFIVIDSFFVFGASCGPLIGGIVTLNANILGLNINDGNSPAVVMVIVWAVLLCVLLCPQSDFGTQEIADEVSVQDESKNPDTLMKSFNSTVWCLFYALFISTLVAATCSANLSILATQLFHLKLKHVNYLFGVGTMCVFCVNLTVYNATSYYSEHGILAFGIIIQLPSVLLLFVYSLLWKNVSFSFSYSLMVYICSGMQLITFSFTSSLLSKITPTQHASTVQSLLSLDYFVAFLVGRGISGIFLTQELLIVYSIGLLALCLVGLAWLRSTSYRLSSLGTR